jgi:hypothetical protein
MYFTVYSNITDKISSRTYKTRLEVRAGTGSGGCRRPKEVIPCCIEAYYRLQAVTGRGPGEYRRAEEAVSCYLEIHY